MVWDIIFSKLCTERGFCEVHSRVKTAANLKVSGTAMDYLRKILNFAKGIIGCLKTAWANVLSIKVLKYFSVFSIMFLLVSIALFCALKLPIGLVFFTVGALLVFIILMYIVMQPAYGDWKNDKSTRSNGEQSSRNSISVEKELWYIIQQPIFCLNFEFAMFIYVW